jgi:hydroxymethylpyrimidine pyrophosphatase-like HAD family hydrolase
MPYRVLATDYDGTIATRGAVDDVTLNALRRARDSGIRLLLVSGRELENLQSIFPHTDLFERLVLENGGVLYDPTTARVRPLCNPPPPAFVLALRERGVRPLSVGRVIVATLEPHQTTVIDVIREQGLELQVIFNKGAVMVLPSGVNKASGLREALVDLRIDPAGVVGVGDAENDHALLEMCGIGAAVANALPAL